MKHLWMLGALLPLVLAAPAPAAEVKILLPLGRTAYQTNERIDVAVVRGSDKPLAVGELVLKLSDEQGGGLGFTFPVKADGSGRAVEHLYVNGWLLRPGKYALEVSEVVARFLDHGYLHNRRTSWYPPPHRGGIS
jgi:hypothetical protein